MSVKIRYKDISPAAKADSTLTTTDKQAFVDLAELKTADLAIDCGTLELNLIGNSSTATGFAETPTGLKWWSESLSQADAEATFETPIILERTFTQYHSAVGITFTFDIYNNDFCTHLNVKWYRDNTLLYDKHFAPTSSLYFCRQSVELFNKIVITFKAMSKPHRYLKVFGIDDGATRIFNATELENVNISESLSFVGNELGINTLNFNFASEENTEYMFQNKQQIEVFNDDNFIGLFFLKKGKRRTFSKYSVSAVDYIGLIDKSEYKGGVYSGITVGALIADILGSNVPFEIETALQSVTVSGYIPYTTKRKALQQVAIATCAVIDTSRSDKVKIYRLANTASVEIDEDSIYSGGTIDTGDVYTGVRLTQHSYALGDTQRELFNDVLHGESMVKFSKPYGTLSITGGTIVESNANYAKISGTGETVVLNGYEYVDTTNILSRDNINITAETEENIVSVENATLVTSSNGADVLDNLYDYYIKHQKIAAKIKIDGVVLGQKVEIRTEFSQLKEGRIESMDYYIENGLTGQAVVLLD